MHICRKALDRAYRYRVKMELSKLEARGYGKPIIVAPCKPTSKNVLAKGAAEFLGKKLKIEVDESIEEVPCASRRDMDRRLKFFSRPEFRGDVQKGRLYIVVDDMVTTGSTMAEIRSHIIRNGGHVAFTCSLASDDGTDKKLHLHGETKGRVESLFSGLHDAAKTFLEDQLGILPYTLTQPEAEYLTSGKGRYALSQQLITIQP